MFFSLPASLSDDSVTRLPYYTGDTEEDGDPEYAPGSRDRPSLGWRA